MLKPFLLSLLLLASCALQAAPRGGRLVNLEVYDRSAQRVLPLYRHHGRLYVAGEPGHEYELRLRNRGGQRLLAVASIDGVNVITGETAAVAQSGYVLDGHGELRVDGWRKNLDEVASFYFTALPDSYAARTGRPDDVGVIGVALFRERRRSAWWKSEEPVPLARDEAGAAAPPSAQAESRAAAPRLGTGHGERQWSGAEYTAFERAADEPDEVLTIWYDAYRNLARQGVVPRRPAPRPSHRPDPFPVGFVPDP